MIMFKTRQDVKVSFGKICGEKHVFLSLVFRESGSRVADWMKMYTVEKKLSIPFVTIENGRAWEKHTCIKSCQAGQHEEIEFQEYTVKTRAGVVAHVSIIMPQVPRMFCCGNQSGALGVKNII